VSRDRRLWILFGFLAAGFLCLAGRLFALQVVLGDHYEELATRRVRRVEWMTPMRGAIRDRSGRILARDRVVYDLDVTIPDLVYVGSHEALVANIEAAFRATNSRMSRSITRRMSGPARSARRRSPRIAIALLVCSPRRSVARS
jgi:hypothetical protein